MIVVLGLLLAATPVVPKMPVAAEQRAVARAACVAARDKAPAATRDADFRKCLARVPYDGDLPPKKR